MNGIIAIKYRTRQAETVIQPGNSKPNDPRLAANANEWRQFKERTNAGAGERKKYAPLRLLTAFLLLLAMAGSVWGVYSIGGISGAAESVSAPEPAPSAADLGLTYKMLYDNRAAITGYNGTEADLVIPDILDGYTVVNIDESAFDNCESLVSVTIPETVTSIGMGAFRGCVNLTSVSIPNNVTKIGSFAFMGCSSLTGITIPEGVISIGDWAFGGCSSLTSATLPDSVTDLGENPFPFCDCLTSVQVSEHNPRFCTDDGVLYDKEKQTLLCYPAGKQVSSFIIPSTVTRIENCSFRGCYLTSVTIPDSVVAIGSGAFWNCFLLTSVTIPNSVTSIGHMAFYECVSLGGVTIPDSVTSIGDWTFMGCNSLTIYGAKNSAAEAFANDNGIPFEAQ